MTETNSPSTGKTPRAPDDQREIIATETAGACTDVIACSWRDWVAALVLFLATAAVVLWQDARLAVLWDLSYVLENSFRISLGSIPYRDFVLPYAPLTFLTQAVLIKLTGRVFFHHIIYCAAVGGLGTVLAWRILLNLLYPTLSRPRLAAFLLSAPITVLGIYSIFPHPFYDPDCTFVILLCIFSLQRLERKGSAAFPPFFTGVLVAMPLFVKQNTGLAFLLSATLGLVVLMALAAWRGQGARGYGWTLVGAAAGIAAMLLLLQGTAGLANYVHWTATFAASRRMPAFADMAGIYWNRFLPWWIATFFCGALLSVCNAQRRPVIAGLSVSLMAAPFAWPFLYLLVDPDASERAERLLLLWPFLVIVSLLLALWNARRRAGITLVLPFILIGTLQGAFLSQQLWGSTYALWPLFMILAAGVIEAFACGLSAPGKRPSDLETMALTSVIALSLMISGGFYVWSHERLNYAKLSDGQIYRSTLPALAGLSVHGPWIPQFEELVRFAGRNIPEEDGLLMIPGEDLFYYTTGRRPRFPVLMFDRTVNPYRPEEILQLSRAKNIRWLVVKRDLQLADEPVEDKSRLLDLLRQDFTPVERLDNYDVFRRNPGTDREKNEDLKDRRSGQP